MTRRLSIAARLVLVLGVLALLVGAACSSEDDSGPGGSAAGKPTVDANGVITVITKDNAFDPKEFVAQADQKTTVTVDNKGAALHNFEFTKQKDAEGKTIGTDPQLVQPNQKGTATFTLPAGTYDFYCSVHPAEMRGKVIVQ